MCTHEISFLMGTADGIVCRCCGRLFKDMAEIEADRNPAQEKPAEAPIAEKPKRTRKKKEDA